MLTYADATDAPGKATADSDVVEARFVDLVSDDPAFAGTMIMTWAVTAVDDGTRVDVTADDVPDGISPADHAVGLASSLEDLAAHLGRDP